MVTAESAARLAASLLAILHTRVELAATEIEEESLRYFSCLILSLAALFCRHSGHRWGSRCSSSQRRRASTNCQRTCKG